MSGSQLKTEFRKYGEDFKMIERRGSIALFRRGSGFEVIRIRVQKKDSYINGNLVRGAGDEYYPSSEEFGQYGWCFMGEEKARKKYEDLCWDDS